MPSSIPGACPLACFPGVWEQDLVRRGLEAAGLPLLADYHQEHAVPRGWQCVHQMMAELAANVRGHHGVMINAAEARKLGIEDGDTLEVQSVIGVTHGPAIVVQGIRPDTLVMVGAV